MRRCFACRQPLDNHADHAADVARLKRHAKEARAEAKEWRGRAQAAGAELAALRGTQIGGACHTADAAHHGGCCGVSPV